MRNLFKTSFTIIAAILTVACTSKEELQISEDYGNKTVSVSINGIIDGYAPQEETKAEAQTVIRILWKGGETVYVYDGTTPIGSLTASIDGTDGSYAKLSGTITAPSGTKPVTLVYSPQFTDTPTVTEGKISLDLSVQDTKEVPFLIYGTIPNTTAASINNIIVKFSLATAVYKCNCAGLDWDGSISQAVLGRTNTLCELNLSDTDAPSVSASAPGRITRTAGFSASDTRAIFSVALAMAGEVASRKIEIVKGSITFTASFSKTAFDAAKAYNAVFDFIPKPTKGQAVATISDRQVEVGWVQLWNGGPKFAEYNVGVTDGKAISYGGYYGWGGIEPDATDWYQGPGDLSGETDTATRLWGDNWRMPTLSEMTELIGKTKCTCTWTDNYNGKAGLLCRGLEGSVYADNIVFLPAAGYLWYFQSEASYDDGGSYGYYSTSNRRENTNTLAYLMRFNSNKLETDFEAKSYGYSVRAVLVEKEEW